MVFCSHAVSSAEHIGQVRLTTQLLWKQKSPRHCSVLQGKHCSPDIIIIVTHHSVVTLCLHPLFPPNNLTLCIIILVVCLLSVLQNVCQV